MPIDANPYLKYLSTISLLLRAMIQRDLSHDPKNCSDLLPYWELSQDINGPLKVLIAGEFKTGKSTFINALLKKTVLKSDVTPATAVITKISHGNDENVTVKLKNKSSWIYPISELASLTAEGNTAYDKIRQNIEEVSLHLPNSFLKYLTIVDSPGLNVLYDKHISATENVISKIDYIVWLMNVSQPAKRGEIERIKQLPPYLRPMVVVNGMDIVNLEEDDPDILLDSVRNKVGEYARGVFGVSAKTALYAYENNKIEQLKDSGFPQIEKFITNDLCAKWFIYKYEAINGRLKSFSGKPFYERFRDILRNYYPTALE